MVWSAAMLVALGGAAQAQIRPQPGTGDPRLQTVNYDSGQIIQLQGTPGYQLTIQLSSDEQVQNVSIGDSTLWQVSVNKAGNYLFLKPTQAGAPTNMTVITNVRVYNFELTSLAFPTPDMAYTLQFKYPSPLQDAAQAANARAAAAARRQDSRYRMSGDAALRPAAVSDDGEHTYVDWAADRPIPAIFQIGDNGEERLVNGGMRGDEFVIDGVAPKLIFRIDQKVAYAERRLRKRR
jgi:type IV secretion system protein VirB9